jgi:catechol 2,3-dioxygenase-like lactoylglutathione lyase family enzyme
MLTEIIAVTLAAPDLDPVERAYVDLLDYRVGERGTVSGALAAAWGAPRAAGARWLLLQPASGAAVYLRVVESPPTAGYAVMKTHGWNSNEILVQDTDAVAKRLTGSAFRIVGPPRPISTNPEIRAMQAIGPADELIYLTRSPPAGSLFIKTPAATFIDRTFIVVLGGPDMKAMQAFYRGLGLEVTEPVPARIEVLNDALAQPSSTCTPLALVRISASFVIELDEYPALTGPRPTRAGDLPPGIAMVSFVVDSLASVRLPWVVSPGPRAEAPYLGRRSALVRGAAGELIELVESAAPGG